MKSTQLILIICFLFLCGLAQAQPQTFKVPHNESCLVTHWVPIKIKHPHPFYNGVGVSAYIEWVSSGDDPNILVGETFLVDIKIVSIPLYTDGELVEVEVVRTHFREYPKKVTKFMGTKNELIIFCRATVPLQTKKFAAIPQNRDIYNFKQNSKLLKNGKRQSSKKRG